jgi:hypothetical protein
MQELTQETLKSVLNYDPETGVFTWKERPWLLGKQKTFNVRFADKQAGSKGTNGYMHVGINKKDYYLHRLSWLYVYGYMPSKIDHIDTIRSNNKIQNLRIATNSENAQNVIKCHPNNKYSGLLGAHYDKNRSKFYSVIMIKGKENSLDGLILE